MTATKEMMAAKTIKITITTDKIDEITLNHAAVLSDNQEIDLSTKRKIELKIKSEILTIDKFAMLNRRLINSLILAAVNFSKK